MDRISEAIAALEMALFLSKNMWVQDISKFKLWQTVVNVLYLFEENAASSVVTKSIEEAPSSV
jgi:hypothetical protein